MLISPSLYSHEWCVPSFIDDRLNSAAVWPQSVRSVGGGVVVMLQPPQKSPPCITASSAVFQPYLVSPQNPQRDGTGLLPDGIAGASEERIRQESSE